MQNRVYQLSFAKTHVGNFAWKTGVVLPPSSTKVVWRSRDRHDPGSGNYQYWGYRRRGELPISSDGFRFISPGTHLQWTVPGRDSKNHEVTVYRELIWPEGSATFETRSYYWGSNSWNAWAWWAERCINYVAFRQGSSNWCSLQMWYTYGSHFSEGDSPSDHWYDNTWWGIQNKVIRYPNGGVQNPSDFMDFESEDSSSGPAMDRSFFDLIDSGSLGSVNNALARVYTSALTSLPRTTMNNIANILDIVKLLKTFVGGHLDLPTGLDGLKDLASSGWMGYRYSYGTTKMDIQEGAQLVNRLRAIAKCTEITTNSVEKWTIDNVVYTFRCSVTLGSDQLKSVASFAERWGIALDAYNIWDMIPYSFILDWFLDIGGLIEYYEGYDYALRFSPISTWFSISKVITYAPNETETYFYRWSGRPPDVIPVYTSYNTGTVTLVKRGLDVLAMLA